MTDRKPTVCLDFDGVVHAYTSAWTTATEIRDGIVPGAIEFMEMVGEHYTIAIHSSRSHVPGGVEAMKAWLFKHWIVDDHGAQTWFDDVQWPLEKPPAMIYIDDRGFRFEGDWPSLETIRYLSTPWNRPRPEENR